MRDHRDRGDAVPPAAAALNVVLQAEPEHEEVPEEFRETVLKLYEDFKDTLISFNANDHRVINDYFLKLSLTDTSPMKIRPYPLSPSMEPDH